MPEEILVERPAPHIVRLVINRAEKLNALTKPMWKQLGDLALDFAKDDDIRCLMLRGAGEKAFGPGNDISEFANERSNVEQARSYGRIMHDTLTALRDFPAPTVAQIHGICVGGGMEIAGCCDIRIAGAGSRFGAPIKNLGLVMAYGELEALVGLVGPAAAKEILFEGRVFGAEEALAKGVLTRIVADEEVADAAMQSAQTIATGAPMVARWHKRFIKRLSDPTPLSAAEYDEGFQCFGTEDFQTGYKAFLAKETPEFKNR